MPPKHHFCPPPFQINQLCPCLFSTALIQGAPYFLLKGIYQLMTADNKDTLTWSVNFLHFQLLLQIKTSIAFCFTGALI